MSTYTVVAGDSFFAIADRLGVDRNAFVAANPQVANINLITPGQVLNIPGQAPGGSSMAVSGMNSYAVMGAVGLGLGLLWLYFRKRSNPASEKRGKGRGRGKKKLRKMTAAQYLKAARRVGTAYQVGTSLARQYR